MRSMFLRALLLIAMLSIVTGQRSSDTNKPSLANHQAPSGTEQPIPSIPRGNIKKVIKVNKLSKSQFPKTTTASIASSSAVHIGTESSVLQASGSSSPLQTNSPTPRLARQNPHQQQTQGRRVLRKSSIDIADAQSQASSPNKQTYLIGDLDADDYYSRRRARFLFKSRVGK